MNWNIGFFIWVKGLAIFAIPCLVAFPIGIFALIIALIISWPAIVLYSLCLQLAKHLRFPFAACIAFMMLVPSSASIAIAMWILNQFTDFGSEASFSVSELYLIPLFFCMLSVGLSNRKIRDYVNPNSTTGEFIIE